MSNRTDFDNVATEWLDYEVSGSPAKRAVLVPRLATELRNAFVAGQEAEDASLRETVAALAIALRAVEWAGPDGLCPACEGQQPVAGIPAIGLPIRGGFGHREDCALDSALRKAGVR